MKIEMDLRFEREGWGLLQVFWCAGSYGGEEVFDGAAFCEVFGGAGLFHGLAYAAVDVHGESYDFYVGVARDDLLCGFDAA